MPDTPSIVIAKSFNYRGVAETWTNKYHFKGTTPSGQAGWLALLRAIWTSERAFLGTDVSLVGGAGYAAGNNAAVAMFDATNIGGSSTDNRGGQSTSSAATPGDTALWVRWSTADRNSKNKPIYLRKYFHGILINASDGDTPTQGCRDLMIAHGAKMYDGTLPGGVKICGPQGADALAHAVAGFVTTRTLKRNARTPT